MTPLIEIGLIVAAYIAGRIQQFVSDARSVLNKDKHNQRNR